MQCFPIELGAEFTAAQAEAALRNKPLECIDVDMNRLCNRLFLALRPTPCNVCSSVRAWLALPRTLVRILFPAQSKVDVMGAAILHVISFRFLTWLAIFLALLCVVGLLFVFLAVFGGGPKVGKEHHG